MASEKKDDIPIFSPTTPERDDRDLSQVVSDIHRLQENIQANHTAQIQLSANVNLLSTNLRTLADNTTEESK